VSQTVPPQLKGEKDVWQTPSWVYEGIAAHTDGIELDPCAGATTEIGDVNLRLEDGDDGLSATWAYDTVFVNPPFSEKTEWLQKVVSERDNYTRCFVVTPASTGVQSWWHGYIAEHADAVWFPNGRLSYYDPIAEEETGSPPFPSAVSVYGDISASLTGWFNEHGWVVEPMGEEQASVTDY